MLQQCNDNELYDAVIRSEYKYENLNNIRMRYLNYFYDGAGYYQLTLNHPEDLVSLSTERVKISNMGQCVNLRNLYSKYNTYSSDDIVPLRNIRRIYSLHDNYEQNDNCFLQDLFENNKLEYVYIDNGYPYKNVVNSFVIQDNIENLRYVTIWQEKELQNIKLNIN